MEFGLILFCKTEYDVLLMHWQYYQFVFFSVDSLLNNIDPDMQAPNSVIYYLVRQLVMSVTLLQMNRYNRFSKKAN